MSLLTLTEAAGQLGIAVKTLRNWVGAERIEYVQYSDGGRILFRQDTIDAVIAASTKPARGRKYVPAIHTSQQTRSAA
jgi:excisionase family DNA binding protein